MTFVYPCLPAGRRNLIRLVIRIFMHSCFPKGTTIHIIFKDGRTMTGKFADHKSGKVLLEDGMIIDLKNVRAMSPRKLEAENSKSTKKIIFRDR